MLNPKSVGVVLSFVILALTSFSPAEDVSVRFNSFSDAADQLLISALEVQQTDMDCSHLVHYLYERSGLEYDYANSIALYKGVKEFRRVAHPHAGDVIVWRGHVGIVVDPAQHSFVSALRTGVKMSSYVSSYWKARGIPRFFHYVG